MLPNIFWETTIVNFSEFSDLLAKGKVYWCSRRVSMQEICKWPIIWFDSGFYRPRRSCGKVIFSQACVKNSVHMGGGGVCLRHVGIHPPGRHPPREDTFPGRQPPGQIPPSPSQTVRILLECILVRNTFEMPRAYPKINFYSISFGKASFKPSS